MKARLRGGLRSRTPSEAQIPTTQYPAAPRTAAQRALDPSAFPSAITSSLTLVGVDGAPEILLYSKGFSEVDQTTETEQTLIFGL